MRVRKNINYGYKILIELKVTLIKEKKSKE
jgi:hypothetical protein